MGSIDGGPTQSVARMPGPRALIFRIVVPVVTMLLCAAVAELAVRTFIPVRDVGPSFTVYDPVHGKRLKGSFSAQRVTPEFRMRFSTNSLGFRGPELKGAPRRTIVFVGDSFTMGYGVSDGEEYPARIGADLRRRCGDMAPTVVNAGIGYSGNGFWVKFLRGEAEAFDPEWVIMQLFDNDFEENVREQLFALDSSGSLRELPVPPPDAMRRLQTVIEAIPGLSRLYLVGLLRQVHAPHTAPSRTQRLTPNDALTLRIVEEAISICRRRGWRLLAVLTGLAPAREGALANLFARSAIPMVKIPSKTERPDLYYGIDGHWRASGHAFVAERILDALDSMRGGC
jgi:hypothetical protein